MANEDKPYTDWLHGQRCCLHGHGCAGAIEVHHRTGAGLALRAHDHEGIPLCKKHHHERHSLTGYFKNMVKAERKLWESHQIEVHRSLYTGEDATPPF